jgi:hypothetical protein
MSDVFKGNYSTSIQENHQFFCDEFLELNKDPDDPNNDIKSSVKLLKELSMMSFTLRSCSKSFNSIWKDLKNTSITLPQDLKDSKMQDNKTLIDYTFETAYYTEFNKGAQTYQDVKTTITTAQEIYDLIKYHEERQFNSNHPKDNAKDTLLETINNSLEKSIIIKVNLFNLEQGVYFKLTFFQKNLDNNNLDPVFKNDTTRSNSRGVAFNGINIAGVPQTPYGQSYSYNTTSNFQSQSPSNIGSIVPADPRNQFSQDKVAGKLETFYDPNTNTWNAGNIQILARLLTDIDPAPIQSLPEGDLKDSDVSQLIDACKGFTTGKAMPLSLQKSNPHTFGPDYIECGTKKMVEMTVVNRSLRKYTKGQVVMLTKISGEWIVQDFGQDVTAGGGTRFGDWHFIKLIANTDTYFKDDRYYTAGTFPTKISPSDYESRSRIQFYNNKLSALADDNILTSIYNGSVGSDPLTRIIINFNRPSNPVVDFVPSKRYYVASIFDQLGPKMGGLNDTTYLFATNIEDTAIFNDPLFKYAEQLPAFWGPVYSDGHSKVEFNPNGRDNNSKIFFDASKIDSNWIMDAPQPNGNINLNFPAECSSTFINPSYIFNNWSNLGKKDFFIDATSASGIRAPFYGTSIPSSKNRIQFSPLQAEFAASDDLLSTKARNPNRRLYDVVRAAIFNRLGISVTESLFGKKSELNMYKRSNLLLKYPDDEFVIKLEDISGCTGTQLYDNPATEFNSVSTFNSVKYDCFVKRSNTGYDTVGSPQMFISSLTGGKDGANCVGIISAKQTITKKIGGKLNYSINQDFGLNQQRSSTLATNTLTIIPGIFSAGGSAGGGKEYGFPQWGSTTDNVNSMGTTALHVRIFDYWPEQCTIFDPRYFGILHFNPNDSSVDIPIPTKDTGSTTALLQDILKLGDKINGSTKLLPKASWFKNPIRRGMLLTNSGFKYLKHEIGLASDGVIVFGGSGFQDTFDHEVKNKNVILTVSVDSSGKVSGVVIKSGSDKKCYTKEGIDTKYRGTNFLPNDFNTPVPLYENDQLIGNDPEKKAFVVSIPSPAAGGKPAVVKFEEGVLYFIEQLDEPPKEQIPMTRLTSSSKRGEGFIQEVKESDFTLESNNSGKYDCFYHFHNDITHTLITDRANPYIAGFLQYITMTIT